MYAAIAQAFVMMPLSQRLKLLTRTGVVPPGDAARLLIATLDYAASYERDAIAEALLGTHRPEAIEAVIRRAHLVDAGTLRLLSDQSVNLDPPLRSVIATGDTRAVRNALDVIRRRGDAALLRHAVGLLRSDSNVVREEAAETMLEVIVANLGENGRRPVEPARWGVIDDAAATALEQYPAHRDRNILLAAAIASAKAGPKLRAILDEPNSPACLALRSVIRDMREPLVRRNLLRWLTHPALSAVAARSVHLLRDAKQFDDVLASGHLLRAPGRRRMMRSIERPLRCLPATDVVKQMNPGAQRWLPEVIGSLGLRTARRVERLGEMTALEHPGARVRAVADLCALSSTDDSAGEWLEAYCFDADPAAARIATLALLSTKQVHDAEFLNRLAQSNPAEIAQLARITLARLDAQQFFEHWLALDENQRLAAAHRVIAINRGSFIERLRSFIATAPRESRLAALALARRLGLIESIEDQILIHAASADARTASLAVSCLAQVRSPRARDAARAALRHADARVRANAIEAIAAWNDPPMIEIIAPLATSRANRGRANAIRAMIECKPDAAEANLRLMLRDANPLHRVSALWAAGRSRMVTVVDEVATLARLDECDPVRERAAVVRRAMLMQPLQPAEVGRHMEFVASSR